MLTQEYVDSIQSKSTSQLGQDIFVLKETNFKKDGYFVEFGATNGKELSNTWLLEKEMGWTGIVAEPAHIWHDELQKNRSCLIDFNCVWSESGKTLEFNQVLEAELSTIDMFSNNDEHAKTRQEGDKYDVNTISLMDLLRTHGAPKEIDYLSIDTEGSEFEILSAFDFDAYKIKVITCEHNFTPMRDKILNLLLDKGYVRKYQEFSQFDDWYVLNA